MEKIFREINTRGKTKHTERKECRGAYPNSRLRMGRKEGP